MPTHLCLSTPPYTTTILILTPLFPPITLNIHWETPISAHTNTFDCYAFHIQINVTIVLLPFTLQMLPFHALPCWATTSHCRATRLLYLVAHWATTFQSNLASPEVTLLVYFFNSLRPKTSAYFLFNYKLDQMKEVLSIYTIFNKLFNHGILLFSGYCASTIDDDTLNNPDVSQMSLD